MKIPWANSTDTPLTSQEAKSSYSVLEEVSNKVTVTS